MWSSLKSLYYVTCTIVITTYIATCICACITTARMYMYYHYCTIQPLLPMYYYKYSSIIYICINTSLSLSLSLCTEKFKVQILGRWLYVTIMNEWMNEFDANVFAYFVDYYYIYLLLWLQFNIPVNFKGGLGWNDS